MENAGRLLDKLILNHHLEVEEYLTLLKMHDGDIRKEAAKKADKVRQEYYGKRIFIRGLIEISNYCKNDCLYCGIRCSNKNAVRYRLSTEDIIGCCKEGYALGFRTFVLQGGEDKTYTDEILCSLIKEIKKACPGCAVTLSLGERGEESFRKLYEAGADRYLLRHETADREHYRKLHPKEMSYEHRMLCLKQLKEIGYQTGCGFMIGSPYQTLSSIAQDLYFIQEFKPEMCGIGPFIPHHDTPFAKEKPGTLEDTLYLLSLIRLICPDVLLPATTALGTIAPDGRQQGILAGANVIMPNLSPMNHRKEYELYDNKIYSNEESAQNIMDLKTQMEAIGYQIVTDRGDHKTKSTSEGI